MKSKRFLAAVTAFVLAGGFVNSGTFSEIKNIGITSVKAATGAEYFTFDKTRGIIENYKGTDKNVVIPSEIDGVTVEKIGKEAFSYCNIIETVVLPDTVTYINEKAFYGCSNLESIVIPMSVELLGADAFSDCKSLKRLKLPVNMVYFLDPIFDGCESLTDIFAPCDMKSGESLWKAGCDAVVTYYHVSNAYSTCSCIDNKEIWKIGEDDVSICSYCGDDAYTLIIPSKINGEVMTNIGSHALSELNSLRWVKISDGITAIDDEAFFKCPSLENIMLPGSVKSIGTNAFYDCLALKNVNIPASVENIEPGAFNNCSISAFAVDSENSSYCTVDGVLFNKDKTVLLQFPSASEKTTYEIPDTVTTIADCAFYGCSNLESITIPASVTYIGEHAFYNCSALGSIKLPKNISSIKKSTFAGCSSLTEITVPNAVSSIGEYAFSRCSLLENVTLPYGLKSIGEYAFSNCSELDYLTVPDTVENIGISAFEKCNTMITLPCSLKSTEYIWKRPGDNIYIKYTHIVSENSEKCACEENELWSFDATSQKIIAYKGNGEKTVNIPSQIGNVAVTGIASNAFSGTDCTAESITIPDTVKEIDSQAFSGCSSLKSLTIPDTVTSIGDSACYNCSNLKTVYYGGTASAFRTLIGKNNSVLEKATLFSRHRYAESAALALDGTLKVLIRFNGDISESDGYTINGEKLSTKDKTAVYAVPAKDFLKDIVIKDNGTVLNSFTITDILTKYKSMSETKRIADALEKYCIAANEYFFSKDMTNSYYTQYSQIMSLIKSHDVNMGESYYGSTLLLKSDTILRHYYTTDVAGSTQKGNLYYIEESVPAHLFSNKDKYCVNDYIYKALSNYKTSDKLKNLCAALYNYGEAAKEYSNK